MDHNASQFRDICAKQLPHFWSSSADARVDGELTTLDFDHESAGLVIPTDVARALHRSLGRQLRRLDLVMQPGSAPAATV